MVLDPEGVVVDCFTCLRNDDKGSLRDESLGWIPGQARDDEEGMAVEGGMTGVCLTKP
jgi:hypothetical protein